MLPVGPLAKEIAAVSGRTAPSGQLHPVTEVHPRRLLTVCAICRRARGEARHARKNQERDHRRSVVSTHGKPAHDPPPTCRSAFPDVTLAVLAVTSHLPSRCPQTLHKRSVIVARSSTMSTVRRNGPARCGPLLQDSPDHSPQRPTDVRVEKTVELNDSMTLALNERPSGG
jgi:hypothetical protein